MTAPKTPATSDSPETRSESGRLNVWGTLLAIYVLATGVQGLQFVTRVEWLSDMFNGLALIVAVGLAVWAGDRRQAATHRSSLE
jgi:ribose transport system permease protein